MIRFLNIVAAAALIGSAVYAYSIKYQTIYRSDQIAKLTRQIQQLEEDIGMPPCHRCVVFALCGEVVEIAISVDHLLG